MGRFLFAATVQSPLHLKCRLTADNPFIGKIMDGSGGISLTAEEHEVLTEYFRLRLRLDDMERRRLYFRGHTDCISYLKKVGAL